MTVLYIISHNRINTLTTDNIQVNSFYRLSGEKKTYIYFRSTTQHTGMVTEAKLLLKKYKQNSCVMVQKMCRRVLSSTFV